MSKRTKNLIQIFKTPFVVLLICLAGLIAALLIEGPADLAAALAAAVPIAVIIWALMRR